VEGGMTDKIKPRFIAWYESDFQAEPLVRHMRPLARHLYRALLIQSSYCSTRPYLPDDDSQLWMLADAESEAQWVEHAKAVRAMFSPVEIEGVKLLSQKRLLVEWEKMEAQYRGRGKYPTPTHPLPTPVPPGGTDNRPELTRTDLTAQNRTAQQRTEDDITSPEPEPNRTEAGSGAGSGSGVDDEVKTSKPPQGTGKAVTGKVQAMTEEEENTARGVKSEDLVARYWLIAKKKPNDGLHCGKPTPNDPAEMREVIQQHGVEKVRLALDHMSRSDWWGCEGQGQLDGIRGFGKALEAVYAQAQKYLQKVKQTAKAGR
jgi:hypothetical protein